MTNELLQPLLAAQENLTAQVQRSAKLEAKVDQLLKDAQGQDHSLKGLLHNALLTATRDELCGQDRDNVIASIRVALGNLEKPRPAPEPTPVNYTELVSDIIEVIFTRTKYVAAQNIDIKYGDPVVNSLNFALDELSRERSRLNAPASAAKDSEETSTPDGKLVGPHERDPHWEKDARAWENLSDEEKGRL